MRSSRLKASFRSPHLVAKINKLFQASKGALSPAEDIQAIFPSKIYLAEGERAAQGVLNAQTAQKMVSDKPSCKPITVPLLRMRALRNKLHYHQIQF